jgi:hypothetical protein
MKEGEQMNEPANTIRTLTVEILILKQQTAQNIIEIGKRLNQVKEQLPHGEWGNWLAEKIDIHERTAQKFMRAASEFGNTPSMAVLGAAKVFALLDLPSTDREPFLAEPHALPSGETKTVDEMTTRELQATIKALKDSELRANNLAKSLEVARTKAASVDDVESDNETLREANHVLESKLKSAGDPIIVEQPVQVTPPDYERIKSELAMVRAKQAGITPERLEIVDKNCKEFAEQQREREKISNSFFEAITAPHSLPKDSLEYAIQCYLDNSPAAGIDEVLWDVNWSITELTRLKQVLDDSKKLRVMKT